MSYLEVFRVQLKNNFVREAVYRTNFLTTVLVDLVWIIVELSFFTIIYSNTDSLAGWQKEQVYFFLGLLAASDALFSLLFARNFWAFSDLVNKGDLDTLLTKPIHPLFLALTRWMSLTSVFSFLFGVILMIRFGPAAGFQGGIHWFELSAWILVGLLTQLILRFLFSVTVFWTERSWALQMMYYQFFQFGTKPDAIYPKAIQWIIKSLLPFAFIASVPATSLLSQSSPELRQSQTPWIWVLLVLGVMTAFALFLWNRGLRRYQSASS
jgi:ABC-2 type transport system permease protein